MCHRAAFKQQIGVNRVCQADLCLQCHQRLTYQICVRFHQDPYAIVKCRVQFRRHVFIRADSLLVLPMQTTPNNRKQKISTDDRNWRSDNGKILKSLKSYLYILNQLQKLINFLYTYLLIQLNSSGFISNFLLNNLNRFNFL